MMEINISHEIHELRQDISVIDKNVTKLTTLVEGLIVETKEQKEKISMLQKFKNKILGGFISTNVLIMICIPLLVALI